MLTEETYYLVAVRGFLQAIHSFIKHKLLLQER
ncbi:hypothetical protein SAMN06269250_4200 [Spirosoma fluviale]|uniref:Uncharacterized protein n=1 Tax=Spirosoma fluviale TaxID=1597977 RepID=A0A286GBF3_9BACT|nr:hypothetical protein SAMN06269250_4200 [Spirosoma fluviale]